MAAPEDFQKTVDIYMDLFSSRWNILIINEIIAAPKRFNEIKRALEPVTQTVLTRHLRQLEEYGIITREVKDPRMSVSYSMTEEGIHLYESMVDTFTWIIQNILEKEE